MQAPPAPQANVPVAAALPPVQPQPLGALTAPNTYLAKYLDAQNDSFGGNFTNLYNEYAVGNTQPLALRNAVYKDGNVGILLHGLVHVQDPNAGVDDPGTIVAVHRLTRHESRFGQLHTGYDNLGLGFYGDIINGQAPSTVVIPDAWFNQTTMVQVPTHGLLAQEFAADPQLELLGPYQAGQPDVQPVTTRQIILVPNMYVTPVLTTGLAPRAAYQVLQGMVQQAGHEVACEPLMDWLRAALTKRGGANPVPVTCVPPAAPPAFANPQTQQAFATYRMGIFHADFPHLQPGHQHSSAALIAQGISALTDEQRLARQEAQQRQAVQAALKTPSEFYGTLLERLMRWCHVPSDADLPPIYHTLANTKKGKIRVTLQTAIEEALNNLHYVEDFPVSTTLANKIQDLTWASPIPDNFALGLNLFCLGSLDPNYMVQQRQINQHADALYNGDAAPSLLDVVALQDSKQDVYIPRTFAQLRYLVERAEALWLVLLGNHHPVTQQHKAYKQYLGSYEHRLERIVPSDPTLKYLAPALLARRVQLATNAWLVAQARSPMPMPFSPLTEIFSDIDLGKQWEAPFPAQYISAPATAAPTFSRITNPSAVVSISGSSISGSSVAGSTLTANSAPPPASQGTTAGTEATTPPPNSLIRNLMYNDGVFGKFKAMNIKAKPLKDQLRTRRVTYPTNARGNPMCLTYQVHGICNSNCRNAADHYAHSAAEDETFRAWCELHYHLDA